ncbi:adenine deaminase [Dyadobacter jejuensis]|nr:adenine deaminase [Dyadobacter jejuensis]
MRVNHINLLDRTIQEVVLTISGAKIQSLAPVGPENQALPYLLPGFVDAHVHIESSMLTPSQFARMAVTHGTVATVSDPHEIANVLGIDGINFMITDGKRTPFKFCFGAPSCVPATSFETAGAHIDAADIAALMAREDIGYLAEVMNFPGVLHGDPELLAKIAHAQDVQKPIDGHAPGLRGQAAKDYIDRGISTDHECFTYEEAKEKIGYGAKILIREGSAARNFDALIPLMAHHPERLMFCSDDKHPDSLEEGHINLLVKRALALGYDLWDVLTCACVNPVLHYHLPVGLTRVGDPADFIIVDNLQDLNIIENWLDGNKVADQGVSLLPDLRSEHINKMDCQATVAEDFRISAKKTDLPVRVIQALEGQLITNELRDTLNIRDGYYQVDLEKDILKLTVINRYHPAKPGLSFINNFGLKEGAIASSVGHDSHNILAVGCDDESISRAVNLVIEAKGGLSAVGAHQEMIIPLPIAGLMSDVEGYEISRQYTLLDQFVKTNLKSTLNAPFMTLSFMALLVIPHLKLSDKGLFDVNEFKLIVAE